MKFSSQLIEGRLCRRYKRFLADVELVNGQTITAHTANTGAMTGCAEPGSRVWLSTHDNPKRKYPQSWEIVEVSATKGKTLVGINTMLSNHLVKEAISAGVIKELSQYNSIEMEVRYGEENSRIDLLLSNHNQHNQLCYVEVKNVTLVENNIAYFPDAVSKRASKHLRELMAMVKLGHRAVIFFCLQRNDVSEVKPAAHIDKEYAQLLDEAIASGVEAIAYSALVTPQSIELKLPVAVTN